MHPAQGGSSPRTARRRKVSEHSDLSQSSQCTRRLPCGLWYKALQKRRLSDVQSIRGHEPNFGLLIENSMNKKTLSALTRSTFAYLVGVTFLLAPLCEAQVFTIT